MSTTAVLALILAVALPVSVFRSYRAPDSLVERWAGEQGLRLTAESRTIVARYLRSASVLRAWGAVAGALLPSLIDLVVDGRVQVLGFGTDGNSAPLAFGWIFVGYLIGALCAELSVARPTRAARRAASLTRREIDAYLPRRALRAQRAATTAGALGTLAVAALPYASVSPPDPPELVLVAAGVLACGAGLEAVERWLVRRPQPFTDAAVVAADNAIRAQSIRAVAGAGLAMLLLFCAGVSLVLQASDVAVLHVVMLIPAAVCFVVALLVCRGVEDPAHRRAHSAGAKTAAA